MLRIEDLKKDYGGQRVLDGASMALKPGERAALVAPNGAGKSTLLKIVAGLEESDSGRVILPTVTVVGYLAQDAGVKPGRSLHDEVLSAVADLLSIEESMRTIERQINEQAATDLDALVHRHAELQEEFERRGGYGIEAEVGRVLDGLGFLPDDRDRPTDQFSGGWQMRIALARLLLGRPDVLLLDEPTNHLDLAATEWLEDYVKASRATMLIVSHDRYFLDSVVQRVFELRQGRIETFPAGNYSSYRVERARRDEAVQDIAQRQHEEIERVEAYIRRYKEGNRATMAKSREKMLARLEAQRVAAPRQDRVVKFAFPACPPSGREVVVLSKVDRAYGPRTVLSDVALTVERAERIALIGPNGAGKSTLLRLLAGLLRPAAGTVALLPDDSEASGRRLHYAGHLDALKSVLTVGQNLAYWAKLWASDAQTVDEAIETVGLAMLAHLPVAVLSAGQRRRAALARLLIARRPLWLLDEPTASLDAAGTAILGNIIAAHTMRGGIAVVATHAELPVPPSHLLTLGAA
jgi:ATP-binding cassette, subfamily F, member 3